MRKNQPHNWTRVSQKEYEATYQKGSDWAYRQLKKQKGSMGDAVNLFKSVENSRFKASGVDDQKHNFYDGAMSGCQKYLDEQRNKRR